MHLIPKKWIIKDAERSRRTAGEKVNKMNNMGNKINYTPVSVGGPCLQLHLGHPYPSQASSPPPPPSPALNPSDTSQPPPRPMRAVHSLAFHSTRMKMYVVLDLATCMRHQSNTNKHTPEIWCMTAFQKNVTVSGFVVSGATFCFFLLCVVV